MPLDYKPLREVKTQDIQDLIDNKVREHQSLDYKQAMYGRADADVRDMLKDVCSIANASGGHILIGIEEGGTEDGLPVKAEGIEDAGNEALRLISSCLSNIQERIPALDAHSVPLPNGRAVLLVRVPRSLRVPHQITYKGLFQCWKRHGTRNSEMSLAEIREACRQTEQLEQKLEDFLEHRKRDVFAFGGDAPCYTMSATPLLFRPGFFNTRYESIRNILKNPPEQDSRGWGLPSRAKLQPSFNGLIHDLAGIRRVEIFRNGHVQFFVRVEQDTNMCQVTPIDEHWKPPLALDGPVRRNSAFALLPVPVIEYFVNFLRFVQALALHSGEGASTPWIVRLGMYSFKGWGLLERSPEEDYGRYNELHALWDQPNLEVDPYEVSMEEMPEKNALPGLERIWNAFGYESVPYFDAEGKLKIPGR